MFFICDGITDYFQFFLENCMLMSIDAKEYISTRAQQFVDFNDVYSSFLYNMLDKSIYIYSSALKMVDYEDN